MSRRDERVVAELLPDMVAIADYFEAKGRTIPPWVYREEIRFHNGVLDHRIPIMAARALRPHLEHYTGAQDLAELFYHLVALADLLASSDPSPLTPHLAKKYVHTLKLMKQLERKYSLALGGRLVSDPPPLEPWEKIPPGTNQT